jgi:hypothetical protein
MDTTGPDADVGYSAFISHASSDREKATQICNSLEAKGFRCWIAPRDVRPGQDYASEIIRGIEKSKAFVLVLSDNANKSPFVQAEVERAYSKGKPIFPIRIAEVIPSRSLELFISTKHWIDAWQGNVEDHSAILMNAMLADSDVDVRIPFFKQVIRLGRWAQLSVLALIGVGVAGGVAYWMQPDPMENYDPGQSAAHVFFMGSMVADYYPLEASYTLMDGYQLDGKPLGAIGNIRRFELFNVEPSGKTKLLYAADPLEFVNEFNKSRSRKIPIEALPIRVVACLAYTSNDKTTSHVVIEGFNFDPPDSIAALFPVTAAGPREVDTDPGSTECATYAERYAARHMSRGQTL